MTKTAQQKKNIILWIMTIIGIFALIGAKTWFDISNQPEAMPKSQGHIPYGYMAAHEDALAQTSQHDKENILFIGTITPQGLALNTQDTSKGSFDVREASPLNLYFRFVGIAPYDRIQHHIDLIDNVIQQYHARGIDIIEIILDYRPAQRDQFNFEQFNTFARKLREQLHREHTLGAFLDDLWFKSDDLTQKELGLRRLGNMSKNVRTYFFDFRNVYHEGDDILEIKKRLDAYKFAYVLRVTSEEDLEKLTKALETPSGFFVGALVDIPNTPPISPKEQSGETE